MVVGDFNDYDGDLEASGYWPGSDVLSHLKGVRYSAGPQAGLGLFNVLSAIERVEDRATAWHDDNVRVFVSFFLSFFVCLFACLFVCLFVCLCVCLFVCLFLMFVRDY